MICHKHKWCTDSTMIVSKWAPTHNMLINKCVYNFIVWIENSNNVIIRNLANSDTNYTSKIWRYWYKMLMVQNNVFHWFSNARTLARTHARTRVCTHNYMYVHVFVTVWLILLFFFSLSLSVVFMKICHIRYNNLFDFSNLWVNNVILHIPDSHGKINFPSDIGLQYELSFRVKYFDTLPILPRLMLLDVFYISWQLGGTKSELNICFFKWQSKFVCRKKILQGYFCLYIDSAKGNVQRFLTANWCGVSYN